MERKLKSSSYIRQSVWPTWSGEVGQELSNMGERSWRSLGVHSSFGHLGTELGLDGGTKNNSVCPAEWGKKNIQQQWKCESFSISHSFNACHKLSNILGLVPNKKPEKCQVHPFTKHLLTESYNMTCVQASPVSGMMVSPGAGASCSRSSGSSFKLW